MSQGEARRTDELLRRRTKGRFNLNPVGAFRDAYKSGVFLLVVLNVLLLGLNCTDVLRFWTGFDWQGEYLKPMLHEGTYLLIISVLMSMAIVLFYFKGNFNFYQKNEKLIGLTRIWIFQNAFLCLSVLVRTYYYVHHFNLAYKRIGVLFFVLFCLAVLYIIHQKVWHRRSTYYLSRHTSVAAYIVLVAACLPNWDSLITKYNWAHAEQAFVELDYLARMNNGVLPLLDMPIEELQRIKQENTSKFSGSDSFRWNYYMTPEEFRASIDERIDGFLATYPERSWREWNYADHRAYRMLGAG